MAADTILVRSALSVDDYRCQASPHDAPFPEVHQDFDLAFVRRGSFGYRTRGRRFQLVAGSVLVGRPGDEFVCTHEHHAGGDECLSIHLGAEVVDEIAVRPDAWRIGALPPLAEMMVIGELAQCAAEGRTDVGLDELVLVFARRFAELVSGRTRETVQTRPQDRQLMVDAAAWIDAHADRDLPLEAIANEAGRSPFHFLRIFSSVLGVTPHQYLVRSRLRRAVRLLCDGDGLVSDIALEVGFRDLSNFVRTFRRASGMTPTGFRKASRRRMCSFDSDLPNITNRAARSPRT